MTALGEQLKRHKKYQARAIQRAAITIGLVGGAWLSATNPTWALSAMCVGVATSVFNGYRARAIARRIERRYAHLRGGIDG